MKNFRTYEIMTGILAGLFAVVIGMAIISVINIAPYFSFLLGCFLSLPIFIVAFGQGTLASLVALISATVVLIIVTNIYIAFGFMLLFFLPAVYASWLLGLARPAQRKFVDMVSIIIGYLSFNQLYSSYIKLYRTLC